MENYTVTSGVVTLSLQGDSSQSEVSTIYFLQRTYMVGGLGYEQQTTSVLPPYLTHHHVGFEGVSLPRGTLLLQGVQT